MEESQEWVEIYNGPLKWRQMVQNTLEESGIPARQPKRVEPAYQTAYFGPPSTAAVQVREADVGRAQYIISKLKVEVPDAFPEGQI